MIAYDVIGTCPEGPDEVGREAPRHRTLPERRGRCLRENSRIAQRLVTSMESVQGDPEKKFEIERFKALGAQVFEGTTDPAGAEAWLNQVEKCFRVMHCPEDRKLDLATFMLQKGAEDWWRLIEHRNTDVGSLTWVDFKKSFQEKYYPKSLCDEKGRNS